MTDLAIKAVQALLEDEDYSGYEEAALALEPSTYATQRTPACGQKCRSTNYEWIRQSGNPEFKLAVRFTATTTLVPDLLSTISPVMPMVITTDYQQYVGSTFYYVADGRGTGHNEHLLKIYRAIQQIEKEVLPLDLGDKNLYLLKMDPILAQYDSDLTI